MDMNGHVVAGTQEVSVAINWSRDVDTAFATAKEQNRPVLLDFSAAPA
jgi:uncharacterized protein YyaL (SSP411 family)